MSNFWCCSEETGLPPTQVPMPGLLLLAALQYCPAPQLPQ
jgi:hypothetical protein